MARNWRFWCKALLFASLGGNLIVLGVSRDPMVLSLNSATCVSAVLALWRLYILNTRERRWFILQHLSMVSLCGSELMDRSAGRFGQGTVYPALRDMERKGWVRSAEEPGGPERGHRPRYRYTITDAGRAWLAREERA